MEPPTLSRKSAPAKSVDTSLCTPPDSESEDSGVASTRKRQLGVDIGTWPLPKLPIRVSSQLPHLNDEKDGNDTTALLKWIAHFSRDEDSRVNLLAEPEHILQQTRIAVSEAQRRYWHGDKRWTTKHIVLSEKHPMQWLRLLGWGKTGVVQAFHYGGLEMARKELNNRDDTSRDDALRQLMDEANNMDRSQHRHTVTLLGTLIWKEKSGDEKLSILTSPVADCNLDEYLSSYCTSLDASGRLNVKSAQKLIRTTLGQAHHNYLLKKDHNSSQLVKAAIEQRLDETIGCLATVVKHIHDRDIRHFDLKPGNIVMSAGELFITDFGISWNIKGRTHSNTEQGRGKTHGFAAPEVEDICDKYSPASAEVYSLGCIFLHIAAVRYTGGRKKCKDILDIFKTQLRQREAAIRIYLSELRSLHVVSQMYDRAAKFGTAKPYLSLIEKMLADNPVERPSMADVDEWLHEMGGPEQIYHGSCCRTHRADRKSFCQLGGQGLRPSGTIDGYLAPAIYRMSKVDSSWMLARDAIFEQEVSLGKQHPDVLMSLDLLVKTLISQDEFVPARKLGLLSMGRNINALGRKHPNTTASMSRQAQIFRALGQAHAAERLLRKALKFRSEAYGSTHPLTLRSMDELADVLSASKSPKQIQEASELLSEALNAKRQTLGEAYRGTLHTMHRLALVQCNQKRFAQAEVNLWTESLKLGAQDRNHPLLLRCLHALLKVYLQQRKYQAATATRSRIASLKRILKRRLWGCDPALHWYILTLPGQVRFIPNGDLSLEEQEKARRSILSIRMETGRGKSLEADILDDMSGLCQTLLCRDKSAEAKALQDQVMSRFKLWMDSDSVSDNHEISSSDDVEGLPLERTFSYGPSWTELTTHSLPQSSAVQRRVKEHGSISAPSEHASKALILDEEESATKYHNKLPPDEDAQSTTATVSRQSSNYMAAKLRAFDELSTLSGLPHVASLFESDIDSWLFNKLTASRTEVHLLGTILEAHGVPLNFETSAMVLTAWNHKRGRGRVRAAERPRHDINEFVEGSRCIKKRGYDNMLVKQVIGYAIDAGLDGSESGSKDYNEELDAEDVISEDSDNGDLMVEDVNEEGLDDEDCGTI